MKSFKCINLSIVILILAMTALNVLFQISEGSTSRNIPYFSSELVQAVTLTTYKHRMSGFHSKLSLPCSYSFAALRPRLQRPP